MAAPTLEEIKAYCKAENITHIMPDRFYEYNSKRGWGNVGNWKSLIKSWEDGEAKRQAKSKVNYEPAMPTATTAPADKHPACYPGWTPEWTAREKQQREFRRRYGCLWSSAEGRRIRGEKGAEHG